MVRRQPPSPLSPSPTWAPPDSEPPADQSTRARTQGPRAHHGRPLRVVRPSCLPGAPQLHQLTLRRPGRGREEETKVVDPAVYASAAREGIVTCLAFGTSIPKKWAKPDGTVFGGVKVDEWDGLCVAHLLASPLDGRLR